MRRKRGSVDKGVYRRVQHEGDRADEHEGGEDAAAHALLIPRTEAQRKEGPTTQAKPQQDRGEKRHQRVRGADRRQGVRAQRLTDDERIRNVVKLLEQIAQNHRQREAEHRPRHAALRQVPLHISSPMSFSKILRPALSRTDVFSLYSQFFFLKRRLRFPDRTKARPPLKPRSYQITLPP